MAKRTNATPKKKGSSAAATAAVTQATPIPTPSDEEPITATIQKPKPFAPTFALNSTAGRVVVLASLATAVVEVYQVYMLWESQGFQFTDVFWTESWGIMKSYWQSKLLAGTYIIKTLYQPAP